MRHSALSILFLLWVIPAVIGAEHVQAIDRAVLETRVRQWMQLDNVSRRAGVNDILALADLNASEGKEQEAIRWYQEGLRLDSWRFDYQLKLARLLERRGDKELAAEKAKEVFQYAEEERLIAEAKALLDRLGESLGHTPVQGELVDLSPAEIILIPLGHVNRLLLDEVRAALQKQLGMRFSIAQETLPLGRIDRLYVDQYLQTVLSALKPQLSFTELSATLRAAGLSEEGLGTTPGRIQFVQTILRQRRAEQDFQTFQKTVVRLGAGGQYDAERLVSELRAHYAEGRAPNVKGYLGVTESDIYVKDTNYVFGWATPRMGVMSYYSFLSAFHDLPPDRPKVRERFIKQALSSSFRILGIPLCTSPICIRAYPHSVEEHDRKGTELCAWCQEQLRLALHPNERTRR